MLMISFNLNFLKTLHAEMVTLGARASVVNLEWGWARPSPLHLPWGLDPKEGDVTQQGVPPGCSDGVIKSISFSC